MKRMNAVAEHTRMVSTKTPADWMRPCLAGWVTCAVDAAFGAEPSPASFENRPRLTPFIIAALIDPAKPPSVSRSPKAFSTIRLKVGPTLSRFMSTTATARPM